MNSYIKWIYQMKLFLLLNIGFKDFDWKMKYN